MRGTSWFLILSFALAWISWEAVLATGVSVLSWEFQLFILPGAFAPAIAAIIVRKWITREGFADAGLRLNLQAWLYYLLAWLLPLFVVAAIVAEAMIFGIARPDFTLAGAIAAEPAGRDLSGFGGVGLLIVPQVMITAILLTPIFWGEEFGWRGYLQTRLFPGRPLAAAAMTGLIWALWHYPLTLRGYNYPDQPLLGTLIFTVFAMLISYIFGWLRERSGSIWPASLAHSATNSVGALALLWLAGARETIWISYGGILALPPLLVVCIGLAWIERRQHATHAEARQALPERDGAA